MLCCAQEVQGLRHTCQADRRAACNVARRGGASQFGVNRTNVLSSLSVVSAPLLLIPASTCDTLWHESEWWISDQVTRMNKGA
ncbi:hypothetical protein Tco_1356761 [Tanacetum coccineum]